MIVRTICFVLVLLAGVGLVFFSSDYRGSASRSPGDVLPHTSGDERRASREALKPLRGEVTSIKGNGVGNAVVEVLDVESLQSGATWGSDCRVQRIADEYGAFELERVLFHGPWVLIRASKDGWRSLPNVIDLESTEPETIVHLSLTTPPWIEGHVVDEGAAPVIGASVGYRAHSRATLEESTTTSTNGFFRLKRPDAGSREIVVTSIGRSVDRQFHVDSQSVGPLTIATKRGHTLIGRVISATTKEPIKGVRVHALRSRAAPAESDAEGTFRIEGLSGGHYELSVVTGGAHVWREVGRPKVVLSTDLGTTIEVQEVTPLLGMISLSEQDEPPKATVTLLAVAIEDGTVSRVAEVESSSDGIFVLSVPEGSCWATTEFRLLVKADNCAPILTDVIEFPVSLRVSPLRISLDVGLELHGKVFAARKPLKDALVELYRRSASGEIISFPLTQTRTEADGSYLLRGGHRAGSDLLFAMSRAGGEAAILRSDLESYDFNLRGEVPRGVVLLGETRAQYTVVTLVPIDRGDLPDRQFHLVTDRNGHILPGVKIPNGRYRAELRMTRGWEAPRSPTGYAAMFDRLLRPNENDNIVVVGGGEMNIRLPRN